MTRILAISNQKGGTAKTTSAINIAAGLARSLPGQRILLVDVDPQANASAAFLTARYVKDPAVQATVYEVLMADKVTLAQALLAAAIKTVDLATRGDTPPARLDILPAHKRLAAAELELVSAMQRESRLRDALAARLDQYAYIIIDCPPALGLLTLNALMAATEVIVPVDPGYFPIIGISDLSGTIDRVQRGNPGLRISGVIPTRIENTLASRETVEALRAQFGNLVLPSVPENVSLTESPATQQDIYAYKPSSPGAIAYAAVVKEIIQRGNHGH
jgi:chromosome partitioning protein